MVSVFVRPHSTLGYGVMVTQQTLVLFFGVRVPVSQLSKVRNIYSFRVAFLLFEKTELRLCVIKDSFLFSYSQSSSFVKMGMAFFCMVKIVKYNKINGEKFGGLKKSVYLCIVDY